MPTILKIDKCPICSNNSNLVCEDQAGYQEPKTFPIYHCGNCNTSYTTPRKVDEELYNNIYKHQGNIGGYRRYHKYADGVIDKQDSLGYLAENEDIYWGIKQYFDSIDQPNEHKVLDVGCGIGYLTYSIHKRGFNIKGIDISATAIETARSLYGNYFLCSELSKYQIHCDERFDTIILVEVIEHIPDVDKLFDILKNLIKENGTIIITTPNKSFFPAKTLWHTAPPPIHFWWFSENSLREIAFTRGYNISFTDFTIYNKKHSKQKLPFGNLSHQTRSSVLDRYGSLIESTSIFHKIVSLFSVYSIIKRFIFISYNRNSSRRESLCAFLSRYTE